MIEYSVGRLGVASDSEVLFKKKQSDRYQASSIKSAYQQQYICRPPLVGRASGNNSKLLYNTRRFSYSLNGILTLKFVDTATAFPHNCWLSYLCTQTQISVRWAPSRHSTWAHILPTYWYSYTQTIDFHETVNIKLNNDHNNYVIITQGKVYFWCTFLATSYR